MLMRRTREFLPKIQLNWIPFIRSFDFDDIFFLESISMYKEITAPATKQNVIDPIDLNFRKITVLEHIMISLAGLL